jgi:hypothetical protein
VLFKLDAVISDQSEPRKSIVAFVLRFTALVRYSSSGLSLVIREGGAIDIKVI